MTQFDAGTTALADITGDYTIDPAHTRLGFVARHAMVTKVRGQFKDFSGLSPSSVAVPSNSVNAPRTLVTIACRATKPIRVWEGSRV